MKIFAVVEIVRQSDANSDGMHFKEVTEQQLLADVSGLDRTLLLDFMASAKPGDYLNWRCPLFRVR